MVYPHLIDGRPLPHALSSPALSSPVCLLLNYFIQVPLDIEVLTVTFPRGREFINVCIVPSSCTAPIHHKWMMFSLIVVASLSGILVAVTIPTNSKYRW